MLIPQIWGFGAIFKRETKLFIFHSVCFYSVYWSLLWGFVERSSIIEISPIATSCFSINPAFSRSFRVLQSLTYCVKSLQNMQCVFKWYERHPESLNHHCSVSLPHPDHILYLPVDDLDQIDASLVVLAITTSTISTFCTTLLTSHSSWSKLYCSCRHWYLSIALQSHAGPSILPLSCPHCTLTDLQGSNGAWLQHTGWNPWTGCQSITGPHRPFTLTPRGNLDFNWPTHACFWPVRGNQSIWRRPKQTWARLSFQETIGLQVY